MKELKNLVVVGQGAPNQMKDFRVAKCVCAYSLDENEFFRIYPVPTNNLRKWDVFDVIVEKNPKDNRENTWKIKNSKKDWKRISEKSKYINKRSKKYPKNKRRKLIDSIPTYSLSYFIKNKKSFGLIKPEIIDFELEKRREKSSKQTTITSLKNLDEGFCVMDQHDYKYRPYIKYKCRDECECKNKVHRQQVIEWGAYEFMRKHPGEEMRLKENYHLFDDIYDIIFLVGNIHRYPKTYIIIDIFRYKLRDKSQNSLKNY